VNQFRLLHRDALAKLFVQVLRLCKKAGLVKLGHVAFDGSKVAANASKHKAMSYKRMQEEERRLAAEVDALLAKADETDAREDAQYGVGKAPEDLPQELQRRESRLERIREAKAALEKEAAEARVEELREQARTQREKAADGSVEASERKAAATRAKNADEKARALTERNTDDDGGGAATGDLPHHRVPAEADGKPKPSAQRNFTDPDSRIMVKGGEFLQGYNAQAAVDSEAQIIVAAAVTNQPPDVEHLAPMLAQVVALLHDVGRFEQYRQFRTFKDSISVNHAELGAQILEDYEVLAPFYPRERSVIAHAVELHNVYAVPAKTPADVKFMLNIVRDADKLDIWRVFFEYFNQPEDMRASAAGLGLPDRPECSPEVLDRLAQQKMVRLSSVKTLNDFKLMQLSWIYDLNFATSFRLLFERDDINNLVATLPEDEDLAEAVQVVREFAERKLLTASSPGAILSNGISAGI